MFACLETGHPVTVT